MSALEGCYFVLWGRFPGTNQDVLKTQICHHGGVLAMDLQHATHLLCDNPGSRQKEAEAFQQNGGEWVKTVWLAREVAKVSTSSSTAGTRHVRDAAAASSKPSRPRLVRQSTLSPKDTTSSPVCSNASLRLPAQVHVAPPVRPPKRAAALMYSLNPSSPTYHARSTTPPSKGHQRKKRKITDTQRPVSAAKDGNVSDAFGIRDALSDEAELGGSLDDCIVPLDEQYSGSPGDTVLIDNDGIWDAMLNLTDLATNKNKYYALQLINCVTAGVYRVYSRWGRIGIHGQTQTLNIKDLNEAKEIFHYKFREKARIEWEDRNQTTDYRAPNRYAYISREYKRKPAAIATSSDCEEPQKNGIVAPRSMLPPALQSLLKLLFDKSRMEEEMREQGVNLKELPLGRLTKQQIRKGYLVLAELSDEIVSGNPDEETLLSLSSRFYSQIPHRGKGFDRPPTIQTATAVKEKLSLLQNLENLRLGSDLLEEQVADATKPPMRRVDVNYNRLGCAMVPLQPDDARYKMVLKYVNTTHNDTQPDWGVSHKIQVDAIFALSSELDVFFEPFAKEPNRQLLWHCSRIGNYTGILSTGLRIAPTEAPSSGFRLGKGLYFTNTLQKAQQYCYSTSFPSDQCMLLCEVALGKSQRRHYDDYMASMLEPGKNSTWGVGLTQHDRADHITMRDGVLVPMGKPVPATDLGRLNYSAFTWNEFVVYDEARVKPRFLVKTTFVR